MRDVRPHRPRPFASLRVILVKLVSVAHLGANCWIRVRNRCS